VGGFAFTALTDRIAALPSILGCRPLAHSRQQDTDRELCGDGNSGADRRFSRHAIRLCERAQAG